jgi:hypothetical protein
MMTTIPDGRSTALAHRYAIERGLGAGGMATVYLAHDVKHNRKVVLKVGAGACRERAEAQSTPAVRS